MFFFILAKGQYIPLPFITSSFFCLESRSISSARAVVVLPENSLLSLAGGIKINTQHDVDSSGVHTHLAVNFKFHSWFANFKLT